MFLRRYFCCSFVYVLNVTASILVSCLLSNSTQQRVLLIVKYRLHNRVSIQLLEILVILDICWNLKSLMEILDISWNLIASPGNYCIIGR